MRHKKTVLITGAAGGIGKAIAHRFARQQYGLVLGDIDERAVKGLSEELSAVYHTEAVAIPGDLSRQEDIENLAQQACKHFHSIDVLVNNAAWRKIQTMRKVSYEDWQRTMNVCLTAPAFLSKAIAAQLELQGKPGVIINVSSVMTARCPGYAPAYVAAKGALDSLTKELAVTYGRSKIRVVGISPGIIQTDLSEDYVDTNGTNISGQIVGALLGATPLGIAGSPEDVASLAIWLATSEAGYITGNTITLDGGFNSNFNSYLLKTLQFPDEF